MWVEITYPTAATQHGRKDLMTVPVLWLRLRLFWFYGFRLNTSPQIQSYLCLVYNPLAFQAEGVLLLPAHVRLSVRPFVRLFVNFTVSTR